MVKIAEVQRTEVKLTGKWSDAKDVEPVFVDEMQIQGLDDRVYITFGQVRLPTVEAGQQSPAEVEIRPVVRLVLTPATLEKLLKSLSRVIEKSQVSG